MASSTATDADAGDPVHRAQVTATGDNALSVAIVEAIAAARGEDPTDVDLRLTDHLHPGALDALYEHAAGEDDATWSFEVAVAEFDVVVRSDGRITVY